VYRRVDPEPWRLGDTYDSCLDNEGLVAAAATNKSASELLYLHVILSASKLLRLSL
jgi:hypothetical protein